MTETNEILQGYCKPNLGCMIGAAYQHELAALSSDLAIAGLDITTTEYLVLRALYYREALQQCEISEQICKDKAAVSRCVTAMEKKGLVTIETVSHKCQRVYLTTAAKNIEPVIMSIAAKRHKSLTDLCSKEELETFVTILNKIIKH